MRTDGFVCACCGTRQAELVYDAMQSIYSATPWSVVQCARCGNLATLPAASPEQLQAIYAGSYLYPVHFAIIDEKAMRARRLADVIRGLVPPGTGKRVFEAGCMFGYLLDALRDDYAVRGIEIGDEAIRYCQSRGLPVTDMSLQDFLDSPPASFDVIVLSHVLEHVSDPAVVLNGLRRRLNPGGKIVVSVPNSTARFGRGTFGRHWGWWQVPVHVNHFNLPALTALAHRCDLRVTRSWTRGGDSLMLLLNVMNLLGNRGGSTQGLGAARRLFIRGWSAALRHWYWMGDEELNLVLEG